MLLLYIIHILIHRQLLGKVPTFRMYETDSHRLEAYIISFTVINGIVSVVCNSIFVTRMHSGGRMPQGIALVRVGYKGILLIRLSRISEDIIMYGSRIGETLAWSKET